MSNTNSPDKVQLEHKSGGNQDQITKSRKGGWLSALTDQKGWLAV